MSQVERHSEPESPDAPRRAGARTARDDILRARATMRATLAAIQAILARELTTHIERSPRLRGLRARWRAGRRQPLARHPLLSRWGPAGIVALVVLVIVFNGMVAFHSVRIVRDHDHWVSHTNIVLAQLATLMTDLDSAENGVHSYLITGDASYLQRYSGVEPRLNGELALLYQLTMEDQPQQQAQALKPLIASDLNYMRTAVTLYQSGQIPQAIALVASGQGKRALDSTRALIAKIRATESALLRTRDANAAMALRATAFTLGLAGLTDLFLLGMVVVLVRKSVGLREQVAIERARAETQAQLLALEETNRRMGEFLSIASHELRTPLTSAKANVQLIERLLRQTMDETSALEESQVARLRELAERAERQMNRQARLVNDLLDLSRIQAGKLEMRPEVCDLAAIAHEAVQEQRTLHGNRRIELTLAARDGEVTLHADADRIGQVLTNYLTNALKYSPRYSPVEVIVEQRGALAYAAVRDAGPGLPLDEQGRVWERFHRVKSVEVLSGSGIGLGLGLYISKTIITRHGGEVGVESAPGRGSLFWLTLPLASEHTPIASDAPTAGRVVERVAESAEASQRTAATSNAASNSVAQPE